MKRITCQWSRNPELLCVPAGTEDAAKTSSPNNPAREVQSECSSPRVSLASEKEDTKKQKQKKEHKSKVKFQLAGIIFLGTDFYFLCIPTESSGLCPIGWSFLLWDLGQVTWSHMSFEGSLFIQHNYHTPGNVLGARHTEMKRPS